MPENTGGQPGTISSARTFGPADQEAFARLSGDRNPLHMDALRARRLMFGQQVVHGMHLVLWALDQGLASEDCPLELRGLSVEFRRPLLLGREVAIQVLEAGPEAVEMELEARGVKLAWLRAELAARPSQGAGPLPSWPKPRPCRELDAGQAAGDQGELDLALDPGLCQDIFPALAARLRPDQIAALLATSRLVGMQCPGLHSVYGGLELASQPGPTAQALLSYQVTRHEPLFSLLLIKVRAAGLQGTIKAFLRPEPRRQAGLDQVGRLVEPGEFQGLRCLVIGGSRGLGEVMAKLVAAGGGEVALTYHQGAEEAQAVATEINRAGGQARCLAWDVLHPTSAQASGLDGWRPNSLAYFATPFITAGQRGEFSLALFRHFCAYYLGGFLAALAAIPKDEQTILRVLYPSSVFVEEPPGDLLEYAAAKAAGEEVCHQLGRQAGLRVWAPRLPKFATDQTASFLPADLPEPAPQLLAALRALQGL